MLFFDAYFHLLLDDGSICVPSTFSPFDEDVNESLYHLRHTLLKVVSVALIPNYPRNMDT